eukprot:559058-Rhodomonas_salina.1
MSGTDIAHDEYWTLRVLSGSYKNGAGREGCSLCPGTSLRACLSVSCLRIRACYAMPGTDVAYGTSGNARQQYCRKVSSAISLRACYTMSGTDRACGAIGLRACYATSGTDLACGATSACTQCEVGAVTETRWEGNGEWGGGEGRTECVQCPGRGPIVLRACYALSGTDMAYGAAAMTTTTVQTIAYADTNTSGDAGTRCAIKYKNKRISVVNFAEMAFYVTDWLRTAL